MKLAHKIGLVIGSATLLLLAPARGRAEQVQAFGDYVVHYSALSTDQLSPDVAKAYAIARSSRRGLLNIAVQKNATPLPIATTATVKATASNLAGQRTEVAMREVKDGDAIYYLGEFPVSGTDTMNFTVDVAPAGAPKAYTLKFNKNYVTD
jgi:hypothetical protein